MKIFNNTNIPANYKASSLAIGNFDGLHKGHQKVFMEELLRGLTVLYISTEQMECMMMFCQKYLYHMVFSSKFI